MLKYYVEDHLNTWTKYLSVLEFAYNSARHSATGKSPFFLVYGRNPDSTISISLSSAESQVHAYFDLVEISSRCLG